MSVTTCLLCGFPLFEPMSGIGRSVSCPVCGDYTLSENARERLGAPGHHPVLSHIARWVGHLDVDALPPITGAVHFPDTVMRLDNLVCYMGEHAGAPASAMQRRLLPAWQAIIGAPTSEDARRTIAQGEQVALLTAVHSEGVTGLALTFDGWERYRALKRAAEERNALIMASSPSEKIALLIKEYVKPLLTERGYTAMIQHIDDGADLRLIPMLRSASLMILDVSGTEDRPPWPTAVAHALGKSVLHLRDIHGTGHHCEPEHCLCGAPAIEWDLESPETTAARLAAALRAISVAAPITPARP